MGASRGPSLTVLTHDLPVGFKAPGAVARRLRLRVDQVTGRRRYGGHPGVTGSLLRGLTALGVPHNYNPRRLRDVSHNVVVLGGSQALHRAILLKRNGSIERLLAGPNVVVSPRDAGGILSDPAIDLVLTPSDWVASCYLRQDPALEGRCVVWAAGVDPSYWSPATVCSGKRILLYVKGQELSPKVRYMAQECSSIARKAGFEIRELVYGDYTTSEYRSLLRSSVLMVVVSGSESQGLAIAEAWSVGIPTFVWANTHGIAKSPCPEASAAPYLTPETGSFFNGLAEFEELLTSWSLTGSSFDPRRVIEERFTDEVSAAALCSLLVSSL